MHNFVCFQDRKGCPVPPRCKVFILHRHRGTTMPRPLLVPRAGWNNVMAMGHGSCGSWVNCVMGHMGHGSQKMTHVHLCLQEKSLKLKVKTRKL